METKNVQLLSPTGRPVMSNRVVGFTDEHAITATLMRHQSSRRRYVPIAWAMVNGRRHEVTRTGPNLVTA